MSKWINWARQQGRQVSYNSRCGLAGDFDTPEYVPLPPYNPSNIRTWCFG